MENNFLNLNFPEIFRTIKIDEPITIKNTTITLLKILNDKDNLIEYYLVEIVNQEFIYRGYLNRKFEKSKFGIYIFNKTNDIYIGEFLEDQFTGVGSYLKIKPNNFEQIKFYEIFQGTYINGSKSEKGVYIWTDSETKRIESFIGEFQEDRYKKGLYFNNTYVYFGEFNMDLKKSDTNAFYFDDKNDVLFYGDMTNDKINNGYQLTLERSNMSFTNIIKYNVSDKILEIYKNTYIDEETQEIIFEKSADFLGIFMSKREFIETKLLKIADTIISISENSNSKDLFSKIEDLHSNFTQEFNRLVKITEIINKKIK